MQREIKFEVRRESNNEIIGYERIGERGQWEHIRINRDEWLLGAITDGQEYSKFIRWQFAGVKDKNGIDIFEGYVCNFKKDGVLRTEPVEFVNGGFTLGSCIGLRESQTDWFTEVRLSIEIIGTIHDVKEQSVNAAT